MNKLTALLLTGSLTFAAGACGSKVDRAGSKKKIVSELTKAGVSDADAQCVAKLVDDYSDADLKALDKELAGGDATSAGGKALQNKVVECVKGTAGIQMIEEIKKSLPNLTPAQETCATDFLNAMKPEDLTAMGTDTAVQAKFGQELATKCLTS